MSIQSRLAVTVGRDVNYYPGVVVVFPDGTGVRVWKNGTDGDNWRVEGGSVQFALDRDSVIVGSRNMRKGPTVEVRLTSRRPHIYSASPVDPRYQVPFAFLPDWAAAHIPGGVDQGEDAFFRASLLEEWLSKEASRVRKTIESLMEMHDTEEKKGGWTHRLDESFTNAIRSLLRVPLQEIENGLRVMRDPVERLSAYRALLAQSVSR